MSILAPMKGLLKKTTGSWYTVINEQNEEVLCKLKGKFRIKGIKSTNPLAVGDIVHYTIDERNETGLITKIEERKNYIIRKSVNLSKQTQIIAANIDTAFLLVTLKKPQTQTVFIDRFLATAEAYSIKTVLVFNKYDQYTEEELPVLHELKEVYEKIGYECLSTSSVTKKGIAQLKEVMKGKISLFSGHSGSGKSTLVNVIQPWLQLKTSKVSEQHEQGKHTTTFAEMHELDFGGAIIDTPGIKGFGVVEFDKRSIADYFPEFFKLKSFCKFHNCIHVNENKCAVKDAVEEDEIAYSRYQSYLQLIDDEEETYRS